MKKALAFISAATLAASFAASLSAQEVPLNTVSGGEGSEVVTGQSALLAAGALSTAGAVVGLAVLAIVAATADDTTGDDTTEDDRRRRSCCGSFWAAPQHHNLSFVRRRRGRHGRKPHKVVLFVALPVVVLAHCQIQLVPPC